MANTVPFIPEGYHSVIPYLICSDGAKAIDFYCRAFGATEVMRMPMPDGRLGHAELRIGDSHILCSRMKPRSKAQDHLNTTAARR